MPQCWQSAPQLGFGTKRPPVQIRPPRPLVHVATCFRDPFRLPRLAGSRIWERAEIGPARPTSLTSGNALPLRGARKRRQTAAPVTGWPGELCPRPLRPPADERPPAGHDRTGTAPAKRTDAAVRYASLSLRESTTSMGLLRAIRGCSCSHLAGTPARPRLRLDPQADTNSGAGETHRTTARHSSRRQP